MKSPFPGMDPYLELHWRDVHATLIVYVKDQLQPQLGGTLRARVEERLVVESALDESREIYPDARVFESKPSGRQGVASGAAVAEPLVIPCPHEERVETFIEIVDRASGDKLVTVIELLSPSNKLRGDAQRKYRQKQEELFDAGNVNLVEIDLTRGGQRKLLVATAQIPPEYRTTYQTCVYRATGERQQFEVYRMPLEQPLPVVKVPLRSGDADALLELQPLVERAYASGAYDDIDYSVAPTPPLGEADAAWADQLLRAAGKR
jgi:Protein of unknown function (DUF4058)